MKFYNVNIEIVEVEDLGGDLGRFETNEGNYEILILQSSTKELKEESIAHELIHFILWRNGLTKLTEEQASTIVGTNYREIKKLITKYFKEENND